LALHPEIGERFSGDLGRQIGPDDGCGKVTKSDDAGFPFAFAKGREHPAQAIVQVRSDDVRAARFGPEDGATGQLVDLVNGELKFRDLGEVNNLIEIRLEPRVGQQPVHVADAIRIGERAVPVAENGAMLFVYDKISGHINQSNGEKFTRELQSLARGSAGKFRTVQIAAAQWLG
jgi:hypothetical protein